MRLTELKPLYCDIIPPEIEEGVLYISLKYGVVIHLCACGCKGKTVMDLQPVWKGGWILTDNDGKITLRPSVGNFAGESRYHAHYYITDNKIEWL